MTVRCVNIVDRTWAKRVDGCAKRRSLRDHGCIRDHGDPLSGRRICNDLKERLGRIIVAYNYQDEPVTATGSESSWCYGCTA